MAANQGHNLFLKNDGSLWGMGENSHGELGDGTYNATDVPRQIVASNVTAIAAGLFHSLFLKRDGSLWGMGGNTNGELGDGTFDSTNRPERLVAGDVVAIVAGRFWSLFLKTDGSVWAMGYNGGQFGNGTFSEGTNRPEQVLAAPPCNIINGQLLNGSFSYSGYANAKYVLDRSFTQVQPKWISQVTNFTSSSGALVFTNLPYPATNIFWRVRFME